MITNEQLWHLNELYWFKDSFQDKETTIDYLKHIMSLADSLEDEGLVKEINDYLKLL